MVYIWILQKKNNSQKGRGGYMLQERCDTRIHVQNNRRAY